MSNPNPVDREDKISRFSFGPGIVVIISLLAILIIGLIAFLLIGH